MSQIQHCTRSLPARKQILSSNSLIQIRKYIYTSVREGILSVSSQTASWDFSQESQLVLPLPLKVPSKIMVSSYAKYPKFLAEYLKINTAAQSWKFLSF